MLPCPETVRLDAKSWSVAGEGARSLVLRDGRGNALRLLKSTIAADAEHDSLELRLWGHLPGFSKAAQDDLQRSWLFATHVLVPLLGSRHACAGRLVRLPAAFTAVLDERLSALLVSPPGSRLGVLLPDVCHFEGAANAPTYTVELKPKCGFLPGASTVGAASVKRLLSRFSLHQRLKLAQGRISQARPFQPSLFASRRSLTLAQTSGYCPLELFSGEPQRIAAALRSLLASPQNNFSVRRDGQLLFGGAGAGHVMEALHSSVRLPLRSARRRSSRAAAQDDASLALALEGLGPALSPASRLDLLVRLLTEALVSTGVLHRLLEAQRLDSCDVEGAFQASFASCLCTVLTREARRTAAL
jgi:inositol-pentakisphosphate 2-kinase